MVPRAGSASLPLNTLGLCTQDVGFGGLACNHHIAQTGSLNDKIIYLIVLKAASLKSGQNKVDFPWSDGGLTQPLPFFTLNVWKKD